MDSLVNLSDIHYKDISLRESNDYDDNLPVLGDPASVGKIQNFDRNHEINGKMNMLRSTLESSGTSPDDPQDTQLFNIVNQSMVRQKSPAFQSLTADDLPLELTTPFEIGDIQQTSSSSNLSLPILSPSHHSSDSGEDIDLNFPSTAVPIESADETSSLNKNQRDIHHPAHAHSLSLIQRTDCDSIICDLCSKEFEGRSWHCTEGCDFDICRDCIKVDELEGSTENVQDIDQNNSESTDTQSVAASISIEIIESPSEKERRGRKRKRMEQEFESEECRIRRKIQKLDCDAMSDPEYESECISEKEESTDHGDYCVDLRGDFTSLYNVRCNSLRCDECGKGFLNHKEFINHMKAEHNECRPYECHLCTKKYRGRQGLMSHYKGNHQYRISRSELLKEDEHDGELNNSASTDSRISSSTDKKPRRRGMGQESEISTCDTTENLRCDDCDKGFESHQEFIDHLKAEHMRTKNETNEVIEKYIEKTMNRKQTSQRFMKVIESGEVEINETSFLCHINECGKTFTSRSHLKRHVNEIHFGRRYKCTFPDCAHAQRGGDFKQRTTAKEHVSNVHFRLKREWQCVFCGDEFTRWLAVKRHLELQRCRLLKAEGRTMTTSDVLECKSQCRRHTSEPMNQS